MELNKVSSLTERRVAKEGKELTKQRIKALLDRAAMFSKVIHSSDSYVVIGRCKLHYESQMTIANEMAQCINHSIISGVLFPAQLVMKIKV